MSFPHRSRQLLPLCLCLLPSQTATATSLHHIIPYAALWLEAFTSYSDTDFPLPFHFLLPSFEGTPLLYKCLCFNMLTTDHPPRLTGHCSTGLY